MFSFSVSKTQISLESPRRPLWFENPSVFLFQFSRLTSMYTAELCSLWKSCRILNTDSFVYYSFSPFFFQTCFPSLLAALTALTNCAYHRLKASLGDIPTRRPVYPFAGSYGHLSLPSSKPEVKLNHSASSQREKETTLTSSTSSQISFQP